MDFVLLAYDLICSHLYSSEFGFFSVVAFNNLKSQYKPINSNNSKIDSIQDEGWKYFNEKGLPPNPETIELWKYTNFHDLDSLKFSSPNQTIIDEDAEKKLFTNKKYNNIFVVDGFFDQEKSNLSESIIVENSSNLDKLEYLADTFGKIAINGENEFISLNSSLMINPLFISIKDSAVPIDVNIIMVTTNNNPNSYFFPRIFLQVEKNSSANIIESYFNLSEEKSKNLVVPVIEYLLEDKSKVNHKRMQIDSGDSYFFQFDRILQKADSSFISTSFSLSGLVSRYDIHSDLVGINSECNLHGLYLTNSDQLQENEISITHSVEKCSSDQMFKGILAGKSKAVFSGKVLVKQDAQKTRAFQKDLNFLLSKDCEVDTKPSLEIYADDVECSHGATAGNMDKNMLFYLQSRGINSDDAMAMLIRGFAQEIIDEFDDEKIIEFLENSVDKIIPKLDIEGIM